ncbi:MAG TPA: APC family permease [Gammaproteobacteria bacterium]
MAKGKLRKDAGLIGLLFAGLSSTIGSGWLFGPMHAAQIAGPLSIGSWAIAALVVGLIAMVYAELGPLFPRSGGLMHISLISHGRLVGRVWSWILFLAYVTIAPVEAMAVVTYANGYLPGMVNPDTGLLTTLGVMVSIGVLGAFVALNFLILRLVLLFNTFATWIKVCAPIGTILVLMFTAHHPENFSVKAHATGDVTNMFLAISTAGVFFSLFGFTQAIQLAGETADPARNIPRAVVGTIVTSAIIYILVQYAFVAAVPPELLAKDGWAGLTFGGGATNGVLASGPMAGLALTLGVSWWAAALYADAIISPAACGYIWTTATARVVMAASEEEFAPERLADINRHGTPWTALILSFVVGCVFFFPFPSWQKLVNYASSATVLSYGLGCVVLLRLRRVMPDLKRPFRLWSAWAVAPAAFIASNLVMYWAGFGTVNVLFAIITVIMAVYMLRFLYLYTQGQEPDEDLAHAWWLMPYFAGMWLLSYFGPVEMGGTGAFGIFNGMSAVAVFSLIILYIALATGVAPARVKSYYASVLKNER